MKTDILDKLTTARVGLLLKAPFFGNLATRMKLVESSDWCSTAATDGRNFFYNTDFINKLSGKKIEFLFGHEILHCVLDHFGRCGSRDRRLANIAQDFAVNQILVDERIGEKITEVDICLDSKYRGMAWEEIYDLLYAKAEKITLEQLLSQLGVTLDEHINGDPKPETAGNKEDQTEGPKGPPALSKEEMEAIRDEIKEAMIQAAAGAGIDNVPAAIKHILKDMTEPKMNWRDYVRMNIQSLLRNDYSFTRPSRKGQMTGAILPGLKNETTIDIAIALDMSGSIGTEDATAFLGEVKAIIDQYEDFAIDLWCFDTEVLNHQRITHDNIEDLLDYNPMGGGGTLFEANFDFMKSEGMTPGKFFMFTDGCPMDGWGDENYVDTVFIIKGKTDTIAPFGQTVCYEADLG